MKRMLVEEVRKRIRILLDIPDRSLRLNGIDLACWLAAHPSFLPSRYEHYLERIPVRRHTFAWQVVGPKLPLCDSLREAIGEYLLLVGINYW